MGRHFLVPVALSVAALGFLVSTGCGIITAPISVPRAIAANHDAHLEGTITDAAGNPLRDVTLTVQKGHTYWDPTMGSRIDYENSSTLVSGTFSVSRRASSRIELIFAKPGYVPALVAFDDHALYLAAAATTQPNGPDAGRVPETQPRYIGGTIFSPRVEMGDTRNAMFVDPSWHPSQRVRIILYPADGGSLGQSRP